MRRHTGRVSKDASTTTTRRSFAPFERGEDIGRLDVLTSLAAELRVKSEFLRDALESRQFEKSVLDDERQAEALGVRGVPAFFVNRKAALTGVQPVDNLKKLTSSH